MAKEKDAFAFLSSAPSEMVARLLATEDQMVAGVILAHAPPTATAKILAYMGADRQRQMVEMMRKGRSLPLEAAERLADHFQRRLQKANTAASAGPRKPPPRPEPAASPQPWRPPRSDAVPVNSPDFRRIESKSGASALALAIAQVRRLAQSGAAPAALTASRPPVSNRAINGEALAAAILRLAPRAVRQNIADNDPNLYNLLRGRMFVFDDLEQSPGEALAMIFTAVELEVAVQALRFGSPRLQERVFAAVSSRRAALMRAELDLRREQRVRLADIEAAQQKVMEVALALQRQGKILIDPSDPEVMPS